VQAIGGESIIDDDSIQSLFKKTDGTPLSIMAHAAPFIDKVIIKQQKPSATVWIKPAAIAFTLIALAGGAYFAYISLSATKEENTPLTETITPTEVAPSTEAIEHEDVTIEELSTTASTEAEVINTPIEEPAIVEPPVDTQEIDISTTPLATENVPPNIPEAVITSSETEPVKQEIEAPKADTEISVTQKTIEVTPAEKLAPALIQLNKMDVKNAQWLSQQNAKNWTMQLLGARDPETLLKFAQRNNLSSEAAWYKTWLSSKPYYVIVYGNYASRDLARAAIADLPQALRSLKPWVKSMASVQKAIK